MDTPEFEPDIRIDQFFGGESAFTPSEEPTFVNATTDEFDSRIFEDVNGLIYLGHLTSSFNQYGHDFVIKTLRSGERLICAQVIHDYEDTLGLELAFKLAYVAACVVSVDARPLVAALGPGSAQRREQILRAFSLISDPDKGWYDATVDAVYDEYSRLVVRQGAAFAALEGKSKASRLQP